MRRCEISNAVWFNFKLIAMHYHGWPSTQPNRITHNLAARHRAAQNPYGSVVCWLGCVSRMGGPLHNLTSQTAILKLTNLILTKSNSLQWQVTHLYNWIINVSGNNFAPNQAIIRVSNEFIVN